MVTIAVTHEAEGEPRIALSPETTKKFKNAGLRILFEKGTGKRSFMPDSVFQEAGAEIVGDAASALSQADIVLKVGRPSSNDLAAMKSDTILAAILDPYSDRDGLKIIASKGITAFAMEFMPRITRAQSMDVLSSQSNLAGYKAVLDAAAYFGRAMPMMMTAAGTVPAARTFVMGAGVAGLQAIATARRLGAVVTATDVRPASKEQVQSLGAKFIAVEDEEFKQAESAGGYAKEMSADYRRKQAELVANHIATQDIVITTALIPGRPAPKLITSAMIDTMKPGSVIFDLAAERGGNTEATQPGEIAQRNGVSIIGFLNVAGRVPGNASSLYARNLFAFIDPFIDKKTGALAINWDDDIVKGTLISRSGQIVHERLKGQV